MVLPILYRILVGRSSCSVIRLPEKLFPLYAPVFNAALPFLGSDFTEFGSIPAYKVFPSTSTLFSTVRDV